MNKKLKNIITGMCLVLNIIVLSFGLFFIGESFLNFTKCGVFLPNACWEIECKAKAIVYDDWNMKWKEWEELIKNGD